VEPLVLFEIAELIFGLFIFRIVIGLIIIEQLVRRS